MDGDDDVSPSAMIDDTILPNGGASAALATAAMGEPMDVETYAGMYTGRTRIKRLVFIADQCSGDKNEAMELEALRMAYDEIKKGEDTYLHSEICSKIRGRLGNNYVLDYAWADSVEKRAALRKEKLENELNGYRTNLIKESIRMGYNDYGDFYYSHGQLSDAFKNYVRTRDYCTTSKHIVQMCLNVILVSIELGQFSHVMNYVTKAEQTPDPLDPVTVAKSKCASGLAYLETKKYKIAAKKFIETGYELGNNYSEVISAQDVGTYGGLCSLASFDRTELKTKVIDNSSFRNFLELVPEVRELINDFYASRYASCLGYMERLKPNLLLDMHLRSHVETLYKEIRHKAIVQYTLPFVSVHLPTMAQAFNTSVPALQTELQALITDHLIQARIDSHNKILYARHLDQRKTTFQKVLQNGGEFEKEVRAMLLRANLVKHEFTNKSSSRKL